MKTTTSHTSTGKFATALVALTVFTATAWAQPKENYGRNDEVNSAYARLEVLITAAEQAVRYTAPAADYDNIRAAWDRLEVLAEKTENELRYRCPREVRSIPNEFIAEDKESLDAWKVDPVLAENK
jgi:hypothetical protein